MTGRSLWWPFLIPSSVFWNFIQQMFAPRPQDCWWFGCCRRVSELCNVGQKLCEKTTPGWLSLRQIERLDLPDTWIRPHTWCGTCTASYFLGEGCGSVRHMATMGLNHVVIGWNYFSPGKPEKVDVHSEISLHPTSTWCFFFFFKPFTVVTPTVGSSNIGIQS